jgi:hypothetical protein
MDGSCPALIDTAGSVPFVHVSKLIGKTAAALHVQEQMKAS